MALYTPQQKLAINADGHLALTANAGSGKTFVLSRKYLEAALKSDGNLSRIIAITFTEKAASELYQKISKLVEEEISIAASEKKLKLLEKIRRGLVSSNISTIHSFCIDLLHQFPVEADLDAKFSPIDEKLSSELIELAVEETISREFDDAETQNIIKKLIRIFASKGNLQNQIIEMIKRRKNVFSLQEKIYSKNEIGISEYFSQTLEIVQAEIVQTFEKKFFEAITHINNAVLAGNPENELAKNVDGLIKKIEKNNLFSEKFSTYIQINNLITTTKYEIRRRGYLTDPLRAGLHHEIHELEDILFSLKNFNEGKDSIQDYLILARFGKDVLSLFDKCQKEYESKKKRDSYLDFEDILLHTENILQNSLIRQEIIQQYDFLMVDEFQDTNEIQYSIFMPILDYLNSGKLFVVGDEKQSIYKFRDADVELFKRAKTEIEIKSGESGILNLPDSFRMEPEICLFANELFNNLFAETNETFNEVSNTPLICAKQSSKNGEVSFLISDSEDVSTESALVSEKIIQLVNAHKYDFSDIAILVRKRKSFSDIEKTFANLNIPYTVVGGRGFYQRQSINDIYNYLSFLTDESNDAALIGLLRSPFFLIPDSTIYEISLRNGENFFKKLLKYSKGNDQLSEVCKILEENKNLSSSFHLTHLLKKLLTETNYITLLANRQNGDQEFANIQKLILLSRNFDNRGFRNLYDFIQFLKDSITGKEDEPQASVSDKINSVKLMTIHQAKGLEFPVVFLHKSGDTGLETITKSKSISISKKFGILTKLPPNDNPLSEPVNLNLIAANDFVEKKKSDAEVKRLLYVGVTRAKEKLFISGTREQNEKNFKKQSFFGLLETGLANDFKSDFQIKGSLKFLQMTETTVDSFERELDVKINVISNYKSEEKIGKVQKKYFNITNVLLEKLPEVEKDQVISATKLSVYNQCSLKYHLIYNLGYLRLESLLPKSYALKTPRLKYEFDDESYLDDLNEKDDGNVIHIYTAPDSQKFGTIVHNLLSKEISSDQISRVIVEKYDHIFLNENDQQQFITEVVDLFKKFENSKSYTEIKKHSDYKNEFEIYHNENNYLMHGVIDKIIFDGRKVIIIDYKTDKIDEKSALSRFNDYTIQLKFYLYISSKLFTNYEEFTARLVFLNQPDLDLNINFAKNDLVKIGEEINSLVEGISMENISKNPEHCSLCPFSNITNHCIVN